MNNIIKDLDNICEKITNLNISDKNIEQLIDLISDIQNILNDLK